MKVEIHLNIDSLVAVKESLNKLYEMEIPTDKRGRVYCSIGLELADKFESKVKTEIKKGISLFNTKKKYKIGLKYHEAWALEGCLIELIGSLNNEYKKQLVQFTINQLNQKLA